MKGFFAIMNARPVDKPLSELGQNLLWQAVDHDFQVACAQGRPSAWDGRREVYENDRVVAADSELSRLQHPMTILSVRLPGVIARIRTLRETRDDDANSNALDSVVEEVEHLLGQQDVDAESQLLHRVRILPTPESPKRAIMPSSYAFRTFDDWMQATHYWYLRLMTIKLRLVLHTLQASLSEEAVVSLRAEQLRMAANIIMAYQTNQRNAMDHRCLQTALVVLWGALSDMSAFRSMPAGAVRSWVLRAVRELLGREVDVNMMDETSGLLEGGPRIGLLTIDTPPISTDYGNEIR
jgi:hypothetical protein